MITILLIDHSLDASRSVRRVLSASPVNNFQLTVAFTSREILEGFKNRQHDVCLIDSAADNGFRLFTQARSLGYEAPIILVTSDKANETVRAMRSGVADCLIRDQMNAMRIERSICYVVEQGRAAELQKQRERRYLALLENADEVVYTHDLDGNFTSMNRAGEQLLGYSQNEILKMNVLEIVVPEHLDLIGNMIKETIDARMQTKESVDLIAKNGRQLSVELATQPIQYQGTTIELQGTARTGFTLHSQRSVYRRNQLFPPSDSSRSIPRQPGPNRVSYQLN
ncbi:MAG: PAS domain S-box protein [Acidobacteriota bacterium]|nr:PAS domain S-box protein [Acidobacteriota bacterium]